MRTAIIVSALVIGLWTAAPAPVLATPDHAESPALGLATVAFAGGVNFVMGDGSVHFVRAGTVTLDLRQAPGRFRGSLEQGGREFLLEDITFAKHPCADGWPEAWNGGRLTVRKHPIKARSTEVRVRHPRDPDCFLLAEGKFVITAVEHFASAPVSETAGPPDLSIRSAEPVAGAEGELAVRIHNDGPGTSAATVLKLSYRARRGRVRTVEARIPELAADEQAVVRIGVGEPLAGAAIARLEVDPANRVAESDEGNNSFDLELE